MSAEGTNDIGNLRSGKNRNVDCRQAACLHRGDHQDREADSPPMGRAAGQEAQVGGQASPQDSTPQSSQPPSQPEWVALNLRCAASSGYRVVGRNAGHGRYVYARHVERRTENETLFDERRGTAGFPLSWSLASSFQSTTAVFLGTLALTARITFPRYTSAETGTDREHTIRFPRKICRRLIALRIG